MKRLPAAVLIAANLYFFGPIATGRVFSSHDIVDAGWPWRASSGVSTPANPLLADFETSALPSLLSWKREPSNLLWNEAVGSGIPGPANLVEGFLSPFALLPAFLLPAAWIETGILFLKLNFGFLFAYLFLRGEKFSHAAATAGACVWAFSPATTFWWLWMQTSVTIAVPLLLLSIRHAAETPRSSLAILGAAGSAAVWVSGGYPFAIAYSSFPAALLALDSPARRLRTLARLAAAASLVVLVAAPAALVSWRFLRSTGQVEARGNRAVSSSTGPDDLRRFVLPDRHVDETAMDRACAVGPAGLALALIGLAAPGRRRLKLALGIPALTIALALFFGGPVRSFLGAIPLLKAASLDRGLFLVVLALALLAAAGAEAIERRTAPWAAAALPLLVAAGLLPAARNFYPTAPPSRAIFRPTPGITALERATGGSRFLATGWTLLPDTAQVFGLRDVRSHLFHEAAYRRLLLGADRNVYGRSGTLLKFDSETLVPGHPDLDRLNVAAIATPPEIHLPLPKIYSGQDLSVFRRPNAAPARLLDPETGRPLPSASIVVLADVSDRFAVRTDSSRAGLLATSRKVFAPYSQLTIDGAPAVPATGPDGVLLAIPLPEGIHTVSCGLRFPRVEVAGFVLGIAGFLTTAIAAAARV